MTNGPPSSGQHVSTGKRVEPERASDHLGHRARSLPAGADLEQLRRQAARAPQLGRRRRQNGLGQVDDVADQAQRPLAEGELGAARGAEQVGGQRKRLAAHVGEQQRGPARGDDAAVDLRRLEDGIDRRRNLHEIAIAPQLSDERAKVREHRERRGLR